MFINDFFIVLFNLQNLTTACAINKWCLILLPWAIKNFPLFLKLIDINVS